MHIGTELYKNDLGTLEEWHITGDECIHIRTMNGYYVVTKVGDSATGTKEYYETVLYFGTESECKHYIRRLLITNYNYDHDIN